MSLPSLANGVLPPGTFTARLNEVVATFDQHVSVTRPALNRALEHAVTIIWSSDPAAVIYLDGSYVTDKVDPVDVDLAVRSDVWTDSLFLSTFASNYPGEETLVDFYFNTKQSAKKGFIYLIP
jgi:hypothetical protein